MGIMSSYVLKFVMPSMLPVLFGWDIAVLPIFSYVNCHSYQLRCWINYGLTPQTTTFNNFNIYA